MAKLEAAEKARSERRRSVERALEAPEAAGLLEARLFGLLKKRNLRVADVVREWDDDGSGTIDPAEFYGHIRALGLQGIQRQASDALFCKLDTDGSGELELPEVRKGLKALQEVAAEVEASEKALVRLVGQLRHAAHASQALAKQVYESVGPAVSLGAASSESAG